jgi:antitoxin component of RelBE/YafQ-DinJ toxin-antitoxin module
MDEWNPLVKPVPGQAYQVTKYEIDEYIKSLQIEKEMPQKGANSSYNSISKPKHYMLFEKEGIEVRDVLRILVKRMHTSEKDVPLDFPLFESDYVQMMQYLMRFMDKNGKEDLEKGRWYLDKLIEAY